MGRATGQPYMWESKKAVYSVGMALIRHEKAFLANSDTAGHLQHGMTVLSALERATARENGCYQSKLQFKEEGKVLQDQSLSMPSFPVSHLLIRVVATSRHLCERICHSTTQLA